MKQYRGPIYGVTGITCGVRDEYPMHQFFLHLLPVCLLRTDLFSITDSLF
jgi:hypothetical protein